MSSGYRIVFYNSKTMEKNDSNTMQKITYSNLSLAMIDQMTTTYPDANGVISSLPNGPFSINPDNFAIVHHDVSGNLVEVEPCYSDNELLRKFLPYVIKNERDEAVVNPSCSDFSELCTDFMEYLSLSTIFSRYANSFVKAGDSNHIVHLAEGANDHVYGKKGVIDDLHKYENMRELTIIMTSAIHDPEIIKSLYDAYEQKIKELDSSIPPTLYKSFKSLREFIGDAEVNPSPSALDRLDSYIGPNKIVDPRVLSLSKAIERRNTFVGKYRTVLRTIDSISL